MEYFEKDLLFRDDTHLNNTCILFNSLITSSLDDFLDTKDFHNIPVFLFLTAAVMEENEFTNLSLESLYNANLNRYNHKDFDISLTSKFANDFLNREFNLKSFEKMNEEYQLIIKNAFDIYTSCLEIYENKLVRMFELIDQYNEIYNVEYLER